VTSAVTTTIVASGAILFVIMVRITIHFGKNPRNRGTPSKDNNNVNIINFISVVSLFVITVWLIKDVPDSLRDDSSNRNQNKGYFDFFPVSLPIPSKHMSG
jgi:Trk-type K+ transport system membrane component